ncbi:hypothetical protein DRP05_12815 [Archaeoglobales archaeon]|nr:MAG: hypothetical protein DRP05_12815 [Archaeoglobales archaeon]
MKRKFNYTGRKKIERKRISIVLERQNGIPVSFRVEKLDLEGLDLPKDAEIYVEAYYRTELKRFEFGTVGKKISPQSTSLEDLAYPENLKFRILIVDPETHKILAHADRIVPENSKEAILPVEFKDLGNEIWRIEYEGDEGAPILCINRKIPNIQNIAKRDAQFLIYVYPAVIREILTHMVFVNGGTSTEDPATEWHAHWLRFCESLGISPPKVLNRNDNNFDEEEVLRWIDDVVTAFCNKYADKFQEYIRPLKEKS